MELYKLSAAELAKMLREGKCTSTQILDSIYERIDAVEDKVEAFVTITKEQAYAKAKEIDEKFARGEKLHPLAGIPIAIKDNICTKDVLTTCSSKMLYNFVPPYDSSPPTVLYPGTAWWHLPPRWIRSVPSAALWKTLPCCSAPSAAVTPWTPPLPSMSMRM